MLTEGKPRKTIVLEGETRYFQVETSHKQSPLHLLVDVLEGKYEIYVSRSERRPGKYNSEMVCNEESRANKGSDERVADFEIAERFHKRFQVAHVYLAIHGLSHTVLRLQIRFGGRAKGVFTVIRSRSGQEPAEGESKEHSDEGDAIADKLSDSASGPQSQHATDPK